MLIGIELQIVVKVFLNTFYKLNNIPESNFYYEKAKSISPNDNDILTRTLNTGNHELRKVKETSSPSIDIQISSNFERLLFDIMSQANEKTASAMRLSEEKGKLTVEQQDLNIISNIFASESTHQEEVNKIISNVHEIHSYLIDPHTATAVGAAKKMNNLSTRAIHC